MEIYESRGKNLFQKSIEFVYWPLVHILWVILWPIINLLKSFIKDARYRTANGEDKVNYYKLWQKKKTQYVRSHMFEACIESTFQVGRYLFDS